MPPLKTRFRNTKESFRTWLLRFPPLRRFVYICYGISFLPLLAVLYAAAGLVSACEWIVKKASQAVAWCVKVWLEWKLLNPEEIERRKRAREARDAVRELPRKRARRLTLGERKFAMEDQIDESDGIVPKTMESKQKYRRKRREYVENKASQQQTIDQLGKSHFWKFPFEVRERIWQYAVGGHHIHIVRRRGRLGNVYCPADDPTDPVRRDLCLETRDEHGFYRPTAWPVDIRPMSLLLSCRQIYSECIDFLYMLNTFAFDEAPIMHTFLTNLLPYRKCLIAHIHIAPNFGTDEQGFRPRALTIPYTPPIEETYLWRQYFFSLDALPNLRSFSITPSLNRLKPDPSGSQRLHDFICAFTKELTLIKVNGPCTLAWPESSEHPVMFYAPVAWGRDDNLPQGHNFRLRRIPGRSSIALMAFFFPFHVQCLHCATYTIIRKATKGVVEAGYFKGEAHDFVPARGGQRPKLARYWTFHTHCGGWIELQYDYASGKWSVTQGAREISDEEAQRHLVGRSDYPEVRESAHELLQELERNTRRSWNGNFGSIGRAMDAPTREMFYRNAGWT